VDISADAGWLDTALAAMALVQSFMQVCPVHAILGGMRSWVVRSSHGWQIYSLDCDGVDMAQA
jgi:hypothetical protein